MAAGKVTVTRGELSKVRALIMDAVEKLDEMIARQDTRPVESDDDGWPVLGSDDQS